MFKPFKTIAVLGAGVMGSQIAAHLANIGLTVHLLDIPAKKGNKNAIVEAAFKKMLKLKPTPLFTEKIAQRIILGNFEEHFNRLAEVDWVIEAVIENIDIKQQLMKRIESVIHKETLISTNTSSLPIYQIVQKCSKSFRSRFLGTHFFNPPRYLKLLEIIPTPDTGSEILARIQWFGRLHLGKGVVTTKDTPGFIANRIGGYAMILGFHALTEGEYTIEEIDTLTGTLIGRAKSATFRTADLAGLDLAIYGLDHLYQVLSQDEDREKFRVPNIIRKLVEKGAVGAKVGQGFYKKEGKQILSINSKTLQYEPASPLNLENIKEIQRIKDLRKRLSSLYQDKGRAGTFFRKTILETLAYSARRIQEIADTPIDIDSAMRWGFNWDIGPFEIWDTLGFENILADMKTADIQIPTWIEKMQQEGITKFYQTDQSVYVPSKAYIPIKAPSDEIHLNLLKSEPKRILWQNPESALLDLGDGVVLYEFRSKANTLSIKVVEGLFEMLDWVENRDFRGMVVGNEGKNFSVGANLAEMATVIKEGRYDIIEPLIARFQTLAQRIHYNTKPIVLALHGQVLGGGCELAMASPNIVAAAESYMGLVELGVGLIPAGGGLMRLAAMAADLGATERPAHIQPFLQQAFETVAQAKVSHSAIEAQNFGFISSKAQIVMNADRRLYMAKKEVIRLSEAGYLPSPDRHTIMVLGRSAQAQFEQMAYHFQQGGFITEYDCYLVKRLASVMTGGDLSAPTRVHENYLLELERETFMSLLGEKKTQERIASILTTKKPLRN